MAHIFEYGMQPGKSFESALRILVVDDSESAANTLGWMLQLQGYDVHIAYDGANALATALDYQPQVILMDLNIPGLDGFQLCRIMREEHGFEHSLFIAQTGWTEEAYRRRSKEAGFAYHLVKPIIIEELHRVIASWKYMVTAMESNC